MNGTKPLVQTKESVARDQQWSRVSGIIRLNFAYFPLISTFHILLTKYYYTSV